MHENKFKTKENIRNILNQSGLQVDVLGNICYSNSSKKIKCKALYLLRHGETLGTLDGAFMSNSSLNSHLHQKGINDILNLGDLSSYGFDFVVVCCDIPRVLETAVLLRRNNESIPFVYKDNFYGIDNGGWEEKKYTEFNNSEKEDYYEREIKHNVFAKSSQGGSWGEVFVNCVRLIEFLNSNFINKRVLLISQGSILHGIRVLLHIPETPWAKYDSNKIFNLTKEKISNYGKITCIYDMDSEMMQGVDMYG